MDSGYKIYTDILRNRILEKVKEKKIYNETQFGFREGRGTIDAVQVVIEKKEKVYIFFVDLKAAFDNLDTGELFRILRKKGIKDLLSYRVMKLYEETSSKIKIGNKGIGEIWNEKGVRQECKLSADMFNIYMSDLEEELKEIRDGGLVVGRKKIWSISYADDIALVAINKEEMRRMLKKLEKYLGKKKLQLNTEKLKIMILGEKRGRKRKEERNMKWY